MDNKKKENYISLREVAQRYDYTRDHLGYLIRKGDLKGKKFGSFYFTKDTWVKDYLENSSKARKKITKKSHQNSDIQQEKKPLQQQSRPQIKKKKKSHNFLREFKQEIYPLLRDIYGLLKKLKGINDKLILNLKKHFQAITTIYLALQKDFQSWFVEIKYLFNSIKKSFFYSDIPQNFITFLRRINHILDFTSPSKKRRKLSISLIISSLKDLKNKIVSIIRNISIFAKKLIRDILWRLSHKKDLKRHQLFSQFSSRWDFRNLIACSLILLGLIMISGGGYLMLDNVGSVNFDLHNKLAKSFHRFSSLVYVHLDKIDITFLSNVGDYIDRIDSQGDKIISQYYATKNKIKKEAFLKEIALQFKEKLVFAIKNHRQSLVSFFNKYNTQKINLAKLTSYFQSINLDISQSNLNSKIIVFKDNFQDRLSHIYGLQDFLVKKVFMARYIVEQRIISWQSYNNQFLAELDNEFFLAKQRAFQGIATGSQRQLAQLKDYLRFVKKPFYYAKSTLSGWFGSNKQLQELENKITKIEKAQEKETLSLSQKKNGLVVVPSQGDNETTKQKIRQSFSDEVTIEPDETGRSGIIRPVFRQPSSQEYLYLMVPLKN